MQPAFVFIQFENNMPLTKTRLTNRVCGNTLTAMKNNQLKLYLIMFLCLVCCAFILCACAKTATAADIAQDCVRIHIRANSNGDADQSVKLLVRDKITAYLTDILEGTETKQQALSVLSESIANLKTIADETLAENGYTYTSSVYLDNEYFPERDYDGYVFPEGCYDALIINLGSGEGNNWWCVAFPPLCFVPDSGSGEQIVYKSWIKEKLDEMFSK